LYAFIVLCKSIVIVIGPTPPGTGVINEHFSTKNLNIADIGTNRMQDLLPKIKKDVNEVFSEKDYNVIITGSTIMYFTGTTYLINNLFISLSLALLIITLFFTNYIYNAMFHPSRFNNRVIYELYMTFILLILLLQI
jgi:hypothetical protein